MLIFIFAPPKYFFSLGQAPSGRFSSNYSNQPIFTRYWKWVAAGLDRGKLLSLRIVNVAEPVKTTGWTRPIKQPLKPELITGGGVTWEHDRQPQSADDEIRAIALDRYQSDGGRGKCWYKDDSFGHGCCSIRLRRWLMPPVKFLHCDNFRRNLLHLEVLLWNIL